MPLIDALDVLQVLPASLFPADLIQPALDVVGPSILEPHLSAQRLEVIFPNVAVALRGRGPLVLFVNGR